MPDKKRVVYLIGTGASHSEMIFRDPIYRNMGLLMPHVVQGVFQKLAEDEEEDSSLTELLNILDTGDPVPYKEPIKVDIESIMTLYETAGTEIDKKRADKLRRVFREVITGRINEVIEKDAYPILLTTLVDMHKIRDIDEELAAIITINYDDFLERAVVKIHDGVNYPFEVDRESCPYNIKNNVPTLCKLHGSFNWENTNPVKINNTLCVENEDQLLWVPPGVIKRSEYYPFNAIWAKARWYLRCDILRIIGCSLSRNDWSLITLLHTTNRLRFDRRKYEIEYIDYPSAYDRITSDFPYFDTIKAITNLTEFRQYLENEWQDEFKYADGEGDLEKMNNWLNDSDGSFNIFSEWLKSKGHYMSLIEDSKLETDSGLFKSFYLG